MNLRRYYDIDLGVREVDHPRGNLRQQGGCQEGVLEVLYIPGDMKRITSSLNSPRKPVMDHRTPRSGPNNH
jgi:hypothetical protein